MLDFTFLEGNQIFGENQLEIFKKCGTKCSITDFSILLDQLYISQVLFDKFNEKV